LQKSRLQSFEQNAAPEGLVSKLQLTVVSSNVFFGVVYVTKIGKDGLLHPVAQVHGPEAKSHGSRTTG
jgi:hypothetical protein